MSILVGFTFNNVHSSTVGLYVDTPSRTIKPSLRTHQYIVPGRSGTLDYGGDTFDMLDISCKLAYRADTLTDMRAQQRAVTDFLAQSGPLVFDDEPDKQYDAKVVDSVDLEQVVRTGTMEAVFHCQPYAESIDYNQLVVTQALSASLSPDIIGTQDAPCIIRIHADTDITNLIITRTRYN